MENFKPFIHLFKTPGGYYFFDVNKNLPVKINEEIYHYLSTLLNESSHGIRKLSEHNLHLIHMLSKDGFLSSNRIQEIIHPLDETVKYHLERKINMITLQVTQQCNLRCDYCVYSGKYENRHHSARKMSYETACKSIDFLFDHSIDVSKVNIGFYGGEPLLEFDLVKKCVKYALDKGDGKSVTFYITTNGTLLSEDIIDFLVENNFVIVISLDGPKEVHDKNRRFAISNKGSFDTIFTNVNRIHKKYPWYMKNVFFNLVIDPQNDISCVEKFISSNDIIKDSIVMASQIEESYRKEAIKTTESFRIAMKYEHFKLMLAEIKKEKNYCSTTLQKRYMGDLKELLHNRLGSTYMLPTKFHHSGPCLPGASRLFVNADGVMYPCERVNEQSNIMQIGHIEKGFDYDKVKNILNIGKISSEDCKSCWAIMHCTLCAKFADEGDHFCAQKKKQYCFKVRNGLDEKLKDYCTLKEFGYNFTL